MRAGMGVVIIGGLVSSLVLTLLIVPVMYTFLDRFSKKHEMLEATVPEKGRDIGFSSTAIPVHPRG